MITEAVLFTAVDGRAVVVMPQALYEVLATRALETRADMSHAIPAAVRFMIEAGDVPLAAWRKFRRLTQSELAKRSGVHRVTIVRMEAQGAGAGRRETRVQLAATLDVPLAAI